MGIKKHLYKMADFSYDKGFRFDIKFLKFNAPNVTIKENYKFNDLFEIIEKKEISELDEFAYAEISDTSSDGTVNPILLNMANAETDLINADYYKKILKKDIIKPLKNSILISSVRPNLKKIIFIDNKKSDIYFTKAFIELQTKQINPMIMYYCVRTILFRNFISVARQGKGYPTLNSKDLRYITFDRNLIDTIILKQEAILSQIEPIYIDIQNNLDELIPDTKIINDVFNHEFKLDLKILHELQKEKHNILTLKDFANNKDLRNSCRFHCKSAQYAFSELKAKFCTKIKDFISEPIVLGASISPSDYDENGNCRYLSMASIKTWHYDSEATQSVSLDYERKNSKKVKKDDIIIARSGEGTIGKVALIEDDINAIFCDFTMRLHFNNYNSHFAYYYFRTEFFQELIYGYKKGLGNNTNIFPNQIQEFPLPDISLDEQQKIVEIIQEKINEQNIIRDKIKDLKNQIDDIIYETVNQKK